jgi:hypothetical protein
MYHVRGIVFGKRVFYIRTTFFLRAEGETCVVDQKITVW